VKQGYTKTLLSEGQVIWHSQKYFQRNVTS